MIEAERPAAAAIATMSLAIELPKHSIQILGYHTDIKFVVMLVSLALFGITSGMSQSAVEVRQGLVSTTSIVMQHHWLCQIRKQASFRASG